MDPRMFSGAPEPLYAEAAQNAPEAGMGHSFFEAPPRRQRRPRNPDAQAAFQDLDRLADVHARDHADYAQLGRRGRDEIN